MIWVDADVVMARADGSAAALAISGQNGSEVVHCPPGLNGGFSVRAGDKVRIAIPDDGSTVRAMRPADGDRTVIAACARWETESIVEWIEYHLGLGFDHIYVYCNDDDPTELHAKVRPFLDCADPRVTFYHFRFVGHQAYMYRHFMDRHVCDADWFIFLDVDEFVAIRSGQTLKAFLASYPECDVLYLNWVVFGPGAHVERPAGSVLLQYTRRDPSVNPNTKVFTRSRVVDLDNLQAGLGPVFWHGARSQMIRPEAVRRNLIGHDMHGYYDDFPRDADRYLADASVQERIASIATINHYAWKSRTDIERRMERGAVGDFAGQSNFRTVLDRGYLDAFMEQFNRVEDSFLTDRWRARRRAAWDSAIVSRPEFPLISAGKSARQSSVSEWSFSQDLQEEASRAVSGVFTGLHAFHTGLDDGPWWAIDLASDCDIAEVYLFNRLSPAGSPERARHLAIDTSSDGVTWREQLVKRDDAVFGGLDGNPLVWRPPLTVRARHLRVRLLGRDYLHLDQIEVYGTADAANHARFDR